MRSGLVCRKIKIKTQICFYWTFWSQGFVKYCRDQKLWRLILGWVRRQGEVGQEQWVTRVQKATKPPHHHPVRCSMPLHPCNFQRLNYRLHFTFAGAPLSPVPWCGWNLLPPKVQPIRGVWVKNQLEGFDSKISSFPTHPKVALVKIHKGNKNSASVNQKTSGFKWGDQCQILDYISRDLVLLLDMNLFTWKKRQKQTHW